MRSKLVVIVIIAVSVLAGVSSYFGRLWIAEAIDTGPTNIEVQAEPVSLHPDDKTVQTVGELHYVGGWALTSNHDDFGGFSAMVLSDGANLLSAINDKGDWLVANLNIESRTPLLNAFMQPFPKDAMLTSKSAYDAESLVATTDGFLVGFEQEHRLVEVSKPGAKGTLSPLMEHADFSGLSGNGGIEAMTYLQSGTLLLFAENSLDQQGTLPAWRLSADGRQDLRFVPPRNYSPTDAKTLPDGRVVLLMRHYSAIDGVSAKLAIIETPEAGNILQAREIAHIGPSFNIDNMEALDYQVLPDCTIRFYMMSDDNFSVRQRTLLLVFDWKAMQADGAE